MRDGTFRDAAAQTRPAAATRTTPRSPPPTSTRTATPTSSSPAPAGRRASRSATDKEHFVTREGRRHRRARPPRSSSTTTTTGCSICSSSTPSGSQLYPQRRRQLDRRDRARQARCADRRRSFRWRSGDIDGDGDTDIVARLASRRACACGATRAASRRPSLRAALAARVSNRSAARREESKSEPAACAALRELALTTPAVAPADVSFGLGTRASGRRRARAVAVGHPADARSTIASRTTAPHDASTSSIGSRRPVRSLHLERQRGSSS